MEKDRAYKYNSPIDRQVGGIDYLYENSSQCMYVFIPRLTVDLGIYIVLISTQYLHVMVYTDRYKVSWQTDE